jgi:hypothetical protein
LIVQDKSASMTQDSNGNPCPNGCVGGSKWTQVSSAMNTVVGMTDTTINWGLTFFPDNATCGVSSSVVVPVAAGRSAAINAAFMSYAPAGATPTRVAIQNAVTYMQSLAGSNPKFLLLATDGLPSCMTGNPQTGADDSPAAIQAVADALTAGYPTFVVGIGDTMGAATLNSLAMAGGRPQMGAATSYYQASNTADLVTALDAIAGAAGSSASCVFDLGTPTDSRATNAAIDVFGDATQIPQDPTHANGWDYSVGTSQITFYGAPCQSIKAGTIKTVSITYICVVQ